MSEPRHTDPTPPPAGAERSRAEAACFPVTEDFILGRLGEKSLAQLLAAVVDPRELASIAPRLGLNPLPGKRLKTMNAADHALLLARHSYESEAPRRAVLSALHRRLPAVPEVDGAPQRGADVEAELANKDALDLARRLEVVLALLSDPATAARGKAALEQGFLSGARPAAPAAATDEPADPERAAESARADRAEHKAEQAVRAAAAAEHAFAERERALKQRIDQLQRELAELQERLGKKNRECDDIRAEWERLKSDLQVAFNRAARFKKALDESKAPSVREAEMAADLARERQRAEIEASKVEILEYQLDSLEHHDEEPPAPGAPRGHDPLPARIAVHSSVYGIPRLLVVGGAGKQRTHREKDFESLKERLGIAGEWRFADYSSWHRDLPRLRNDLRGRFDLVFVLHWNRTTFVQKMHDEARAAQARVRTVPYRGFLSLERAVREEVERFLQEKTP